MTQDIDGAREAALEAIAAACSAEMALVAAVWKQVPSIWLMAIGLLTGVSRLALG